MIHSPPRSYNQMLAGVGLLNQPQRVSKLSTAGVLGILDFPFAKDTAVNSRQQIVVRPSFIILLFVISLADDFHQHALPPPTVELPVKNIFPLSEIQPPLR